MSTSLQELNHELSRLLKPEQFSDYCPNGLQVEGREQVEKIVSGVTACQALIDASVDAGADVVLVHHGYFWKGEDPTITGLKKNRIQTLLEHGISLFAYHLPLDAHPELGNNVQLARVLNFTVEGDLQQQNNHPLGLIGRLPQAMSFEALSELIADKLGRVPLAVAGNAESIETVAWCTGAAQNFIEQALAAGVDAYITGEVSEQTVHIAREGGLNFYSAGHHATERYGVQAVGAHLADKFGLQHQFIDIDNPV